MAEEDPFDKKRPAAGESSPLLAAGPLIPEVQTSDAGKFGKLTPISLCCGARLYLGPDWPTMLVGYALVGTGTGVGCWFTLTAGLPVLVSTWTVTACVVLALALLIASWVNPGLAPMPEELVGSREEVRHCRVCGPTMVDPEYPTFHCSRCDVCIVGYHHHCPWIGKCVGKGNTISFWMLVGLSVSLSVYFPVLLLAHQYG
eukprot:TRINITY_DN7300_c0_g1_i1.p1 TRINITY_DN7300_c0_g1~~TRINITY_DN7300_c0_g1_i1.p1  ORF type:complete len:201 (+),score=24.99 TRINITY_DN7300_c0_g1_i1:48-650(+)